jgi:head-tail adaptor
MGYQGMRGMVVRGDLKRKIAEEQSRLADQRRFQSELKERDEQLKALAALALKHLDNLCPVCAQTYDQDATRKRLEGIARGGIGEAQDVLAGNLNDLLATLTSKEKEAASAELALRTAEQWLNGRQIAELALAKRLPQLGIGSDETRKCA